MTGCAWNIFNIHLSIYAVFVKCLKGVIFTLELNLKPNLNVSLLSAISLTGCHQVMLTQGDVGWRNYVQLFDGNPILTTAISNPQRVKTNRLIIAVNRVQLLIQHQYNKMWLQWPILRHITTMNIHYLSMQYSHLFILVPYSHVWMLNIM